MVNTYAFWNNKGGIGKSYLCFVAATEYAHSFPENDVYVIDMCPQANVSETLLAENAYKSAIEKIISSSPRRTIGGYIEARLNSPFRMLDDIEQFIVHPKDYNANLPNNLHLVCGDNLLEILSEAIRQTSQLSVPLNSWALVINWVRDLTKALSQRSGKRDAIIIIDCNPSFAIYTQQAIVASDHLVVPFTPDESSHRAIKNLISLIYGLEVDDTEINKYSKINFSNRAKEESVNIPKLHTFISNRVTMYEGTESKAFKGISKIIKTTIDDIHKSHRNVFYSPKSIPSKEFILIPDYHSACVISATAGIPLNKLKPGPKDFRGERVQLNKTPLDKYKSALRNFIDRL